ncbi:uncharacterized protein PV09_01213 [Verruconis gallopava]|uniref:FAD dependent oxidoreductase domain-containing protein n=1 Tax=Verruconis gallopava TaxID=253628 RepID=A0A0D2AP19_9PEZI|nr:uncharacterized protein PV09_01213 [Verruconis gallopava]KIW08295.1 hypothetical protein PV09_01213 [Verruconis gallopava]
MASSNTIIVGSGIIGLSTAYYLSKSPSTQAQSIHLVDSSQELFQCASGLAGGFLAADWFAPAASALGALSFKLHRELAEKHDGREKWGYSPSVSVSYAISRSNKVKTVRSPNWVVDHASCATAAGCPEPGDGEGPTWLTRYEGDDLERLSKGTTTAQIDPKKLCEWLLDQCVRRGVQLHQPASVLSVSKDARDELAGVRILSAKDGTETDIPCSRIVVTAGPWTPSVFRTLFPRSNTVLPITPLAGHSLLLRSPRWTSGEADAHAVFCTDSPGFQPEFFSRTCGEIWFGGLNNSAIPLPPSADKAQPDPDAVKQLVHMAKQLLGVPGKDDLQVVREALCFRPVTPSGLPIVSRVPDETLGDGLKTRGGGQGGVFVSAGHGPWGIALSLGTGKILSELVEGFEPSCKIDQLVL